VSCSHFNAATVARRYGALPQVVFNGIDTALFRPVAPDAGLRGRLGVAAGAPLLLFVGRLQPWKGVETAIRALALLPAAHLAVAGDGEDRARLTALAGELGLAARVHFLGAVERASLPPLYAAADLLVATSHASETFGIGLVEAQACGLPVVASRFGGFPEVVDEGRTGLLFAPRDHAALAAAAGALLADPQRRAAMAAAGPPWAAQFAWPAVADRVEAAYAGLVAAEPLRAQRP
jgi:glycosyltransferase involved in cell wall biosynthesis